MQAAETGPSNLVVASLIAAVRKRFLDLDGDDLGGYVSSDLVAINRALARIQAEGLAQGSRFCEWGSGLGGVCGLAALHGFEAVGIEIRDDLVAAARALADDLALDVRFAQGTYLLPGDEDLTAATTRTAPSFDTAAWNELERAPADCDVIFAYPWPGEEACVDDVFARHASAGALLLTFHDWDRVLVQRKLAGRDELKLLAWM